MAKAKKTKKVAKKIKTVKMEMTQTVNMPVDALKIAHALVNAGVKQGVISLTENELFGDHWSLNCKTRAIYHSPYDLDASPMTIPYDKWKDYVA